MRTSHSLPRGSRVHITFGPGDTLALWSRGTPNVLTGSLRPRQRGIERLRLELHESFRTLHAVELELDDASSSSSAAPQSMEVEGMSRLERRRARVLAAANAYCDSIARCVASASQTSEDLDLFFLRDAHAVAELVRVVFLEETDRADAGVERRLGARLLAWLSDHYFSDELANAEAAAAAARQRSGAQRAEQTPEYWSLLRAYVQCGQPHRAVEMLSGHSAVALLSSGGAAVPLDAFAAPGRGGPPARTIEDLHGLLVESPLPSARLYSVAMGGGSRRASRSRSAANGGGGSAAAALYTPAKVRLKRGSRARVSGAQRPLAVDDAVEVETAMGWREGVLVDDCVGEDAIVARYEAKRDNWRKRCAVLRSSLGASLKRASESGDPHLHIFAEIVDVLTILVEGRGAAPKRTARHVPAQTDLQHDMRWSRALLRFAAELRYNCPFVTKAHFAAMPSGRSRRGAAAAQLGRAAIALCAKDERESGDVSWIIGALSGSVEAIAVHCSKQYIFGPAGNVKRRQWPWVLAHLFDIIATDGASVSSSDRGSAGSSSSASGAGGRDAVRRHRARLRQSRMLDYIKNLAHCAHGSHGGGLAHLIADYTLVHAVSEVEAKGAGTGAGQPHRAVGLLGGYVSRERLSGATKDRLEHGANLLALCRGESTSEIGVALDLAHFAPSLEAALCATAARLGDEDAANAIVDLVEMRGFNITEPAPRALRALLTRVLDECFVLVVPSSTTSESSMQASATTERAWLPLHELLASAVDGIDEMLVEGGESPLESALNERFAAVEGLLLCTRQYIGLARTLADVEATQGEQSARAHFVRVEAGRRVAELILSSHTPTRYGPRLLQLAVHLIALAPDAFSHSELCTLLRAVNTAQRSTAAPFSETELASLRGCFAERLAMAAAV